MTLSIVFSSPLESAIKSESGQINFDVDSDNQTDMVIDTTGLGIGVTSASSNLHLQGNAIISEQLGIKTQTLTSNLMIGGTLGFGHVTHTSNADLDANSLVLADTSSDNITMSLPAVATVLGRIYTIKKIADANTLTVSGNGANIDSGFEVAMTSTSQMRLVSNGTQWYILSSYTGGSGNVNVLSNLTWTNSGGDNLASNANNWNPVKTPDSSVDVILDASTAADLTWDVNTTVSSWTQNSSYEGTVTIETVFPGQGNFTQFNVTNNMLVEGGNITHKDNSTDEVYRLNISVGGDLTISSDAVITGNGLGYDAANGPGYQSAKGGTHGGVGGSEDAAENFTGTRTYANPAATYGSFTAPGNVGSGGHSGDGGGAVILSVTGTFTMNGTISTDAEVTASEGGAGGSVNISAGTLTGNGTIRANGENGSDSGGGGRISLAGVTTDTFSGSLQANGGTPLYSDARGFAGTIYLSADKRTNLVLGGAGNMASLRLGSDDSSNYTFENITIKSGGSLEIDGNPNLQSGNGSSATITAGNLDIQEGGTLSANGLGFWSVAGPGGNNLTGANYGGTGGASDTQFRNHAGTGTYANGDATYGSFTNPIFLGSGGGRADGAGGAVIVSVSGTMTVNGVLSADAGDTSALECATGGTVNITAATLTGNGTIRANGGSGTESGSGGRISLAGVTTDTFAGSLECHGGDNNNTSSPRGFAGTIYLSDSRRKDLILGSAGNMTSLRLGSDGVNNYTMGNITIKDGGVLEIDGNPNMDSGKGSAATLIAANITIEDGGTLSADDLGFFSSAGPGGNTGDGGIYGGTGGNNRESNYGSFTNPINLGSGGSRNNAAGAVILNVSTNLIVDGHLSASALQVSLEGGSGGSINITAGELSGTGNIAAISQDANNSKLGSGGRISLDGVTTDSFAGVLDVKGSRWTTANNYRGSAGTIYLNSAKRKDLVIGGSGNITSMIIGYDGSNLYSFGNITIKSGGLLEIDANFQTDGGNGSAGNITLAGNLDLQSGGSISANVLGWGNALGTGGSSTGGGSHGGRGGDSTGTVYGSITDPIAMGSAGVRTFAGGAIWLTVNGNATVDGVICADGDMSSALEGGSGGSINLVVDSINPGSSGIIRANGGGTGADRGGGGRVAVKLTSGESFESVSFQAFGGDGTNDGAAGTVYLETASDGTGGGNLIIDNNSISTASGIDTYISSLVSGTLVGNVLVKNNAKFTIDDAQTLTTSDNTSIMHIDSTSLVTSSGWVTYAGNVTISGNLVHSSGNMDIGGLNVYEDAAFNNIAEGNIIIGFMNVTNVGNVQINGGGTSCPDTDDVTLRSSIDGTQRSWVGGGNFTLVDVDVKDQAGSASITVNSGTDTGNNGGNFTFNGACP